MIRIAFLAYRGSMTSGGQGIYLYALTRELAALGYEIDVFVGPPWPDPMPWAEVTRIENQCFWGRRFAPGPGAFLPSPDPLRIFAPLNFYEFAVTRFGFLPESFAFSLRAARAVIERMRRGRRYQLVHDVQSVGYGLLWLRALGLPVVTTIHHPLSIDRRSSLRRDRSFREKKGTLTFYPVRTQRRVARRLDAVLTSSDASARELTAGFGVRADRVHRVRNGVELTLPGSRRSRPKSPELLFVGRCGDPNKGLEYLLAALAELPSSLTLRVLDGFPAGTALERQIRELGLCGRVRFSGKVSSQELDRAYRSAAVVVLPSLFEGFGLPAVEALAAGTPVVASRAGALPEVIAAAGAGVLVPPADPAALARAISQVLEHWGTEHARALDARTRIEQAYAWSRIAADTARIYQRLLERG